MTDRLPFTEYHLSEAPAVDLLRALGYTYIPGANLAGERASLRDAVLVGQLEAAIRRINPHLTDTNVTQAVRRMTTVEAAGLMEANSRVYSDLVNYFSLPQDTPQGRISQTVRVIDFENPRNNTYVVSNQVEVLGERDKIIPDVVVFVNGLPLALIECKSPTIPHPLQNAIAQMIRYQGQAPRAFEHNQLCVATCGASAAYAPIGADARFYLRWRDPWPLKREQIAQMVGRDPTAQDMLLAVMFEPSRLLDLIRNFTAYETERGRTVKKLARYQQFRAVNKAMERIVRARSHRERGGVIWHTQGSGKSLTMLWLALKLRRPEAHQAAQMGELVNPTVLIVTDRRDLDKQISGTFQRCGFPNPVRAESVADLERLLRQGGEKTILTTVQKFQTAQGQPYPEITQDSNIVVMVDEAHRTQYKGLATNLRTALPNAIYIGFSGTPIDKKDRSTPRTFGSYIDTYTIQQSVEDGATLEIRYDARLPNLHVEGATLDQLFERMFRDLTPEQRRELRQKYANERAIAAAPQRVRAIGMDLLDHYETHIAPNGFKAQVVAQDRHTAMLYYRLLEELNAPECALVMSATNDDPRDWVPYAGDSAQHEAVKARFLNPDDPLKIVIVCDMWLTGFDAPIEQVMYLDSPLREHNLLQAIARVNRTAPGKDYGLVVDYWGVAADLRLALEMFNPEDVAGLLKPLDDAQQLAERHRDAMRFFAAVKRDDLYACVALLAPEDVRAQFEVAFRRFAQTMDMVMPDPAANPYRADFAWLGKIRLAARNTYRDESFELSPLGAKVRALIDDHIRADGMEHLLDEPIPVLDARFALYVDSLSDPRAQAQQVEHALRHEIRVRLEENPVFYDSLRKRLEELIELHRQQRLTDLELLTGELRLRDEMLDQQERENALGLEVHERPFYDRLKLVFGDTAAPEQIAEAAREIVGSLHSQTVIDWTAREDIKRQMRQTVKRQLRALRVSREQIEPLTLALVSLAEVWLKG
jgi:type I restriction enzyme R subunit